MLKSVKRYVRERFERKVISKAEKVDSVRKPNPVCFCKQRPTSVPDLIKNVNQNFSSQFVALKHSNDGKQDDSGGNSKTTKCLDSCWIETFGLSGTLAFGWTLSQNVELRRKRLIDEIISLHYSQSCPLKSALCPYTVFKNALPKHVQTQPHELLRSKFNESGPELPVFGPLTAEEALREARMGLEKTRNVAIAEFENRLGLRCMSKRRYRRALVHFSAGSALQSASAMFNLAQCYELGLGTTKDMAKAAKCYHASSELGHTTATFNLAVFHAQGLGGLKCDMRRARELLEKAAELGEPHAKIVLENRPVSKDEKEANLKNSTSVTDVLEEPLANKKVASFSIDVGRVTKTNSKQSVSVMTEKFAGVQLGGGISVKGKSNRVVTEYPLLGENECPEEIDKLPVSFCDLPPKEFICGIPLAMHLCAPKVSTVQGQ